MSNYKAKANIARRKVLEMVHRGKTSHIASNFSVIDIATVLYENLKPEDEVVWSAGWKAATIYYFLAQQGKIPKEDLDKFPNYPYIGLAETSVPGVHVSGGSMGHGLPIAAGMALAKKLKGEPGLIYCIMSDGEMNEGTTWETAAFASHHKLDNLIVLVDKNKWQAMGRTEDVLNIKGVREFEGFGWDGIEIDGHKYHEIESVMTGQFTEFKTKNPKVIICNTIKGKGVSFMEDHLLFHYKHVDDSDYEKALQELS